jgi:putative FmdB family regulatory protein
MPRYDYRCSACGNVYEKREGFDAPSLQECPTCGSEARRVLTPPAIVFKGSGWYQTDRRGSESDSSAATPAAGAASATTSPSETPAASSDSAAPAKSESSTKSEAKAAAAD